MDHGTIARFVEDARVGRLATVGADGRPHAVPVCFVMLESTVYSAVDHKPKRSRRLRRIANIEATRHACLLLDAYTEDWTALWWVRLDGSARVVAASSSEEARAVAALVRKYPQYVLSPPDGPVLALDVTRSVGWSAS